jgi:hypothetical protein
MDRARTGVRGLVVVWGFCLGAVGAAWAQQGPDTIGEITVIQKAVSVIHAGSSTALPLTKRDPLRVADTLQTGEQARAQVLFRDDTVLTLGPQTRVDISEYLHDPDQQVRRMTLTLAHGTVRALVGRAFSGLGSTFVIRAGSVTVITHAAYCIVWRATHDTGIANIGSKGAVSVVAEGRVVMLEPGSYLIIPASKPPGGAEPVGAKAPPVVRQAISETVVGNHLGATVNELAEQEVEEKLRSCPPGSPPGGICPRKPPPAAVPPATPPAVTSGAKQR